MDREMEVGIPEYRQHYATQGLMNQRNISLVSHYLTSQHTPNAVFL